LDTHRDRHLMQGNLTCGNKGEETCLLPCPDDLPRKILAKLQKKMTPDTTGKMHKPRCIPHAEAQSTRLPRERPTCSKSAEHTQMHWLMHSPSPMYSHANPSSRQVSAPFSLCVFLCLYTRTLSLLCGCPFSFCQVRLDAVGLDWRRHVDPLLCSALRAINPHHHGEWCNVHWQPVRPKALIVRPQH